MAAAARPAHAGFIVGAAPPFTCSGNYNTPCGNYHITNIVSRVASEIAAAPASQLDSLLANITAGGYNVRKNFWPWVVNASDGVVLASGSSEPHVVGHTFVEFVQHHSGVAQPDAFTHLMAAAESDYLFEYSGSDGVNATESHRVAKAQRVVNNATGAAFIVASAFSDRPLTNTWTQQPCSAKYSTICAFAYTRRVLGELTTALLRARTQTQFFHLLRTATLGRYNALYNGAPTGFYPFVYSYGCNGTCEGKCVAHGASSKNTGRTLVEIIDGATLLRDHVDANELHNAFSVAADSGGGYVGYMWYNPGEGRPYLKLAYIVGVVRFGIKYYVGVGFSHEKQPPIAGPQCTDCRDGFNYPCAFANTFALLGYSQGLLAMANRFSDEDAFGNITGGGQNGVSEYKTSQGFYNFVYDYNGTAVAHGWLPHLIGRNLTDIVAGFRGGELLTLPNWQGWDGWRLHTDFVRAASAGGGWVRYPWVSDARGVFEKLAYVVEITRRGGRKYYVGVGLADYDYGQEADGGQCVRCRDEWTAQCPESCAVAAAGSVLAGLITAKSPEALSEATSHLHVRPEGISAALGYSAHLHSRDVVVADADPSLVNRPTQEWFAQLGLPSNLLDGREPTGTWIGPVVRDRNGTTAAALFYYCAVEIAQVLSNGEGINYDTYHLLVEVPTDQANFRNGNNAMTCAASTTCLTSNGSPQADGVTCSDPLVGRPGLCSCSTHYEPVYSNVSTPTCLAGLGSESAARLRTTYEMSCQITVEREQILEASRAQLISTIIAASLIGTFACLMSLYVGRWVWLQHRAARQSRKYVIERIEAAQSSLSDNLFPLVVMSYDLFLQYGRMPRYEEARDSGHHRFLDTYEKINAFTRENTVVFFSHQWLGKKSPDDKNVHYKAICESAAELLKLDNLPASDPKHLFIWLDYTSVPQSNAHLQKMAIRSLAVYASSVAAFVVIAPTCKHNDSGDQCNAKTYQSRGWCRLEQWARISIGAKENFFIYNGQDGITLDDGTTSALVPIASDEAWLRDSVNVMGGNFTVDSDRHALVDSIVGLWSIALELHKKHADDKSHFAHLIFQMIHEQKHIVFPSKYFGVGSSNLIEVLENQKRMNAVRGALDGSGRFLDEEAVTRRRKRRWSMSGRSPQPSRERELKRNLTRRGSISAPEAAATAGLAAAAMAAATERTRKARNVRIDSGASSVDSQKAVEMHEPKEDHLADIEARLNAVEKTLVADELTMEEAGEHESGDSESVRSTELAPTPATVVRPPPVLTSPPPEQELSSPIQAFEFEGKQFYRF